MKKRFFLLLIVLILFSSNSPSWIHPHSQQSERVYHYTSNTIYENKGSVPLNLPDDYVTLNLFPNTSWQTTYLLSVNHPYHRTTDFDENLVLILNSSSIPVEKGVTLNYSLQIIKQVRHVPEINVEESGDRSTIPRELDEFTTAEGSWQVDDLTLRTKAHEIWDSINYTTNVLRMVTALADWIGQNIQSESSEHPLYPTETYSLGKGDCDDQSNLLITFCRILDIPAYLQIGCIYNRGNSTTTHLEGHLTSVLKNIQGYHAWALIYIPPWGWLPYDMTLSWSQRNPLQGITAAIAWRSDVIEIMNVIKSDWAGRGQTQKNFIVTNHLYIYSEDSLNLIDSEVSPFPWRNLLWLGLLGVILIITFSYARR